MRRIGAALVAAFEQRMAGDQPAVLEDPHLPRVVLDLDDALPGGVRDAVEIAADRDHSLVADPPLDGEHRAVRDGRMGDEGGLLLGEVLLDDAAGGGMDPGVAISAQR